MNFIASMKVKNIFQSIVQIVTPSNANQNKKKQQKQEKQEINLEKKNSNSKNNSRAEKSEQNQSMREGNVQTQYMITYEDGEDFISNLSRMVKEEQSSIIKNQIKKENLVNVNVEPLYLEKNYQQKIISFQFEILRRQQMLERVEQLYGHLHQVDRAIQSTLFQTDANVLDIFYILDHYIQNLTQIKKKLYFAKQIITKTHIHLVQTISKDAVNKIVLKQKIKLLKSIKNQNTSQLVDLKNIDEVFYTERSRHKLYLKIGKSETVKDKAKYLQNLKTKIEGQAQKNIQIIEKQILKWEKKELDQKKIQKLVIMIYFIETEPIYLVNQFKINYQQFNGKIFRKNLQKIEEWKQFKYISNAQVKQKIKQLEKLIGSQLNW